MRSLSPFDCLTEATQLIEAGADEFYGIVSFPRSWRFGHPYSSNTCYYPELYVGE